MSTPPNRAPRLAPRDGALLAFDRASGMNALIRGPSTRHLRAAAPRVVMFGLTNACNLRCPFCSRDAGAKNRWDEQSAFEMLAGLARRGVLEVAFGGGEPLVFRGLERLVARLRAETALAVHLTTNGVLLDAARLTALRPHLGEIRLSIYDDNRWPERVAALAEAGGDFGTNVLVTPARLSALPALLARLEELGCPDVALLRHVGTDPTLQLDASGMARLADIARGTSMRVRASVCFAEALGLPTLATEARGDCGAGRDFVEVTSDRTVRSCSFAGPGIPIETAQVHAVTHDLGAFMRHGEVLFGIRALEAGADLQAVLEPAREAVRRGGVASAELVAHAAPPSLARALSARPSNDGEWLAARFRHAEDALRFAEPLGASAAVAGTLAIVRARSVQSRDGFYVTRSSGVATVIPGDEVALDLSLYHPSRAKAPSIDEAARLEEELRARLRPHGTLEGPLVVQWRSISGTVRTKAPLAVLPWMPEFAAAHALSLHLGPRTPYPVEHVIARLHADVAALRRERRARR